MQVKKSFFSKDGANVKSLIISNSRLFALGGVIFMKWLWFFTKPDKCFISCIYVHQLMTCTLQCHTTSNTVLAVLLFAKVRGLVMFESPRTQLLPFYKFTGNSTTVTFLMKNHGKFYSFHFTNSWEILLLPLF